MPETPKSNARVAFGLRRQLELWKPTQHMPDRDAGLEARDIHSRAGVIGVTERDMTVGLAADIQTLGVWKLRGIAIRGAHAKGEECAGRHASAGGLDFLRRHPGLEL